MIRPLALAALLATAACASQPPTPLPPRPTAEELAYLNTPRPPGTASRTLPPVPRWARDSAEGAKIFGKAVDLWGAEDFRSGSLPEEASRSPEGARAYAAAMEAQKAKREALMAEADAKVAAVQAAHRRALAGCGVQATMAGAGFHGFGWNGFFNSVIAEARVKNACEAFVREHGAG